MASELVHLHTRVVRRLNRIKKRKEWSYTQVIEHLLDNHRGKDV